ncbi:MAG: hypothetical protein ACK56I_10615, partial [bacterium]
HRMEFIQNPSDTIIIKNTIIKLLKKIIIINLKEYLQHSLTIKDISKLKTIIQNISLKSHSFSQTESQSKLLLFSIS